MPNKLTKEQLEALALNLTFPFHLVKLMCDDYVISLSVQPKNKGGMSYCIAMYIDGHIKGMWYSSANEHPEQKFLNKRINPLYRKSDIAKVEKEHGKRAAKRFVDKYQKTLVFYSPFWPSGKAALNHLNRVCESIEVLESI